MSIHIEGMKMPKNIGVSVTIYPDGRVIRYLGYGAKEQLGTAVPVPPHGDLIDRDALLDTATIHWSQTTNESCFPIDEIEYAPTIIPAEEGK